MRLDTAYPSFSLSRRAGPSGGSSTHHTVGIHHKGVSLAAGQISHAPPERSHRKLRVSQDMKLRSESYDHHFCMKIERRRASGDRFRPLRRKKKRYFAGFTTQPSHNSSLKISVLNRFIWIKMLARKVQKLEDCKLKIYGSNLVGFDFGVMSGEGYQRSS